jgi:SAM-dependent methyltransferase
VVAGELRQSLIEAAYPAKRLISSWLSYKPLEHGQRVFDDQYSTGEWDYLRSSGEAPRFGVVAAYCRKFAPGGSVLEVGCGEGILLEHLGRDFRADFTGIDISPVAVDRARALQDDGADFYCADAESFEPARKFDLVVFNEMLYYLDDPLGVVPRYEDALSDDGYFIVSMFSTSATRHVWKGLQRRYDVVAHATIGTQGGHSWKVKVLTGAGRRRRGF